METTKSIELVEDIVRMYSDRIEKLATEIGIELKRVAKDNGCPQILLIENEPNCSTYNPEFIAMQNLLASDITLSLNLHFLFACAISDNKYLKDKIEKTNES
jgi:hypothetical protein